MTSELIVNHLLWRGLLAIAIDTDAVTVGFEPCEVLEQILSRWSMFMGQVVQAYKQLDLGLAERNPPRTQSPSRDLFMAEAPGDLVLPSFQILAHKRVCWDFIASESPCAPGRGYGTFGLGSTLIV